MNLVKLIPQHKAIDMRKHDFHALVMKIGYAKRLIGPDIPKYKVNDNPDVKNHIVKYYPGGEITDVKYPVLHRLYEDLKDRDIKASVLYIRALGDTYYCSDDKSMPIAEEMREKIGKIVDDHDIVIVFDFDENTNKFEPRSMGYIYQFLSSLMHIKHCGMFTYDNVCDQSEFEFDIRGNELRCLYMEFDTESG